MSKYNVILDKTAIDSLKTDVETELNKSVDAGIAVLQTAIKDSGVKLGTDATKGVAQALTTYKGLVDGGSGNDEPAFAKVLNALAAEAPSVFFFNDVLRSSDLTAYTGLVEANIVNYPQKKAKKAENAPVDAMKGTVALYNNNLGNRDAFIKVFTDAADGKSADEKAKLQKAAGGVFDMMNKFYGGKASSDLSNANKDITSDEATKKGMLLWATYILTLGLGFVVDKIFKISGAEQANSYRSHLESVKAQGARVYQNGNIYIA